MVDVLLVNPLRKRCQGIPIQSSLATYVSTYQEWWGIKSGVATSSAQRCAALQPCSTLPYSVYFSLSLSFYALSPHHHLIFLMDQSNQVLKAANRRDDAVDYLETHTECVGVDLIALRRKIDRRVLPYMFCCYVLQFLDKVMLNVSR